MILSCPNCGTRYVLDPARLGPGGRMVRCARCQHAWFATAPEDAVRLDEVELQADVAGPTPDFAAGTQASAAGEPAADAVPGEQQNGNDTRADDEAFGPGAFHRRFGQRGDDMPFRRNLPAIPDEDSRANLIGWAALAAFVIIVVGGILLFPRQITSAWPPAATLYATLGIDIPPAPAAEEQPVRESALPINKRLTFVDLKPSQRFIDGVLTLVITGSVRNIGPATETVPLINVVLLDGQKLDIKTWTFAATARTLAPGQSVPFETRLQNPPADAQDIRVTFATALP